ncbi:MAG: translation initiation factor IF-3 [Clostridia bacterium]|nr:translation initiation factor IF-3 [Clostridia bacterium]
MNRRCITISAEKDNKLINEDIRLKEIRLVGPEDEQLGIMSSEAALRIAYEKGLDLVLMAPNAVPPVCRIMDYGKFRFDREKKMKEARKKQQVVEMKEVQLSCRIDTHDFETKARHAQTFLSKGNKVRVVMRFKGREMSHMAIGREIMDKFIECCAEFGAPEKKPVLDGRSLSTVIAPVKAAAGTSKKKSEQTATEE